MSVKRYVFAFACAGVLCVYQFGHSFYKVGGVTEKAATAAAALVASLNDSQKSKAIMPVESPERQDWQIIQIGRAHV